MDLFELGYYLYNLYFFPCEVNSYEFMIRVYNSSLLGSHKFT